KVHKDFVRNSAVMPETSHMVKHFMEDFSFSSFNGDLKAGDFGFDGAFKRGFPQGDFHIFRVFIPLVEKQSDKKCSRCNGNGEDECREGEKCLMCHGTGKEHNLDWKTAYAISASFTAFFLAASLRTEKKDKTSCSLPQLITVETLTIQDQHGGSLGGVYSIPLVKFLSSFEPHTEIGEMTSVMWAAWKIMFPRADKYERHSFRANVDYENGWLNVSCYGDACGLNPSDGSGCRKGEGYKFSCHNTDSPMQQLALIAGLAALCDRARREIKSY
ncbi:MAG: hypothetical protein NTY04_00925, partial [Candidatus Staskawiczbacteria bacterium]|nr:hypothetical protein [Candidatus Staskawiczbacteria bacterium]